MCVTYQGNKHGRDLYAQNYLAHVLTYMFTKQFTCIELVCVLHIRAINMVVIFMLKII